MKHQRSCSSPCHGLQCKFQHDVPKKAELDSDWLCFHEFPEWRFELAAKQQTEKLSGDLQDAECLFVAGLQFCEEFLVLQLKCDLLVGVQDGAYSFRNARNREDACTTFTTVLHWEVPFEETFYRRFAVLALNVHRRHHRSKSYRFSPGWWKPF
jgi:hypothetical protein